MQLVTFDAGEGARLGAMKGDYVVDLATLDPTAPKDMISLIVNWQRHRPILMSAWDKAGTGLARERIRLLAPIPRPGKIMAIGLNYADHIAESGMKTPEHQVWFAKMGTSVCGPFDPVLRPKVSEAIDYEAEMVAVIGRAGKHIKIDDALSHVFGYCVGNDVTVRDWQWRTPQWIVGKSFDTHAPFGPWITTADSVADAGALGIRAFVNGEKRQESNTRHLVFNLAQQIAHLSEAMTLEPGDIIFTGTPGGVGAAMKPPHWLKAGDRVRIEIDILGAIENTMIDEA